MKAPLPLRSLHRINLLMTIFINLFVFVGLLINENETFIDRVFIFLRGLILIYLLGLVNIFTLYIVQTRYAHALKRPNLTRYFFGSLFSLLTYFLLTIVFAYLKSEEPLQLNQRLIFVHFSAFAVFNTLLILIQDQVLLHHSKAQSDLENMQLKAAISEASNRLLRQQIHPHFLFNSLTILKSLYKKDAVQGEFYVTRLANFLRASISNHTAKISSLETELALCKDYMEMQKIRFGCAVNYTVDIPNDAQKGFVPFFSIQILLENAIKHNVLTEAHPLRIKVSENNGYITVSNNIQAKKIKEITTGFGLENLAERYQLLSGDKTVIEQNSDSFSVSIKLLKDENCNY